MGKYSALLSSGISIIVFVIILGIILLIERGKSYYFDPQDFVEYEKGLGRQLPVSAKTATFLPLLKHYIGVMKLLITVAAASIAFGAEKQISVGIGSAKIFLAWSILFGIIFCAFLIWRYDEYGQNVRSYTRVWYSLVQASGFSALVLFILGYIVWAWNLAPR